MVKGRFFILHVMKQLFFLLLVVFASVFISCGNDLEPRLIGTWQIDSVYDYYNGFTFTDKKPYPLEVHVYQPDKTMLRKGMGEVKTYYFELNNNTLTIRDLPLATTGNEMEIVTITDSSLVLRKNKRPDFPGANQERYELRYFHRVSAK